MLPAVSSVSNSSRRTLDTITDSVLPTFSGVSGSAPSPTYSSCSQRETPRRKHWQAKVKCRDEWSELQDKLKLLGLMDEDESESRFIPATNPCIRSRKRRVRGCWPRRGAGATDAAALRDSERADSSTLDAASAQDLLGDDNSNSAEAPELLSPVNKDVPAATRRRSLLGLIAGRDPDAAQSLPPALTALLLQPQRRRSSFSAAHAGASLAAVVEAASERVEARGSPERHSQSSLMLDVPTDTVPTTNGDHDAATKVVAEEVSNQKSLVTRKPIRRPDLRHQRNLAREEMRRQFDELPEDEAQAILEVVEHVGEHRSGYLDPDQVARVLKELGLRGSTWREREAIRKLCHEVCASGVGVGTSSRNAFTPVIDVITLSITLLPKVRRCLAEVKGQELSKLRLICDETEMVNEKVVLEFAHRMKLDCRLVLEGFHEAKQTADGISFEMLQHVITSAHTDTLRLVRQRETTIMKEMDLSLGLFNQFRNDLVQLYDSFARVAGPNETTIPKDVVCIVLLEHGVAVPTPAVYKELEQLFGTTMAGLTAPADRRTLEYVLLFTALAREREQESALTECSAVFKRYDKQGKGSLSLRTVSALLSDVGCIPHSKKEQDELAMIMQDADADGSGSIDFKEFRHLNQRIQERLRSLRFASDVEYAIRHGFSEEEFRECRGIFWQLDVDGSGGLDFEEIKSILFMLKMKCTSESLQVSFAILDQDDDRVLDFKEFIDLLVMLRDGDTQFQNAHELAREARFLDSRVLRMVMERAHLTKAYILVLPRSELISIFCEIMKIRPTDNLHRTLKVNTINGLLECAERMLAENPADL